MDELIIKDEHHIESYEHHIESYEHHIDSYEYRNYFKNLCDKCFLMHMHYIQIIPGATSFHIFLYI